MDDPEKLIGVKISESNLNKKNSRSKLITMYDEYSCDVCHNNGVDPFIRRAFGVNYCAGCKGKLKLISQTTAVKEYLLSKEDLSRLQKIEVPNPKRQEWRPMLLYSKEEIEKVSREKYENIEEEKTKRAEKKKERGKKVLKKKLALLKKSLRPRVLEEKEHIHVFDVDGNCSCGLKVEQEEI